MPVLLDDDFVLWESNSICRYLARKAERWDLLPAEPQPAAEVEHWMDWQATEFNTARRHAFMGLVRKDPRFQDPVAIKESIAARTHYVRIVEAQLQRTGAWIAGERFTRRYRAGAVGASLENDPFRPSGDASRGALVYGAQSAPGVYAPWQ